MSIIITWCETERIIFQFG